jgi:hypothetical protein
MAQAAVQFGSGHSGFDRARSLAALSSLLDSELNHGQGTEEKKTEIRSLIQAFSSHGLLFLAEHEAVVKRAMIVGRSHPTSLVAQIPEKPDPLPKASSQSPALAIGEKGPGLAEDSRNKGVSVVLTDQGEKAGMGQGVLGGTFGKEPLAGPESLFPAPEGRPEPQEPQERPKLPERSGWGEGIRPFERADVAQNFERPERIFVENPAKPDRCVPYSLQRPERGRAPDPFSAERSSRPTPVEIEQPEKQGNASPDKPEKVNSAERPEKGVASSPEKPERPVGNTPEKPERGNGPTREKPEVPGGMAPEKPTKPAPVTPEKPETASPNPEKPEKPGPGGSEKPDKPEKPNQTNPDQPEKPERPQYSDGKEGPPKPEKPSRPDRPRR